METNENENEKEKENENEGRMEEEEEEEEVEVSDEKFGAFRSALSKLYISRRVDSMTLQEILGRDEGRNRG